MIRKISLIMQEVKTAKFLDCLEYFLFLSDCKNSIHIKESLEN